MITNRFEFEEFIENILKAQYYDGKYKPNRFSTTEILEEPKKIWLTRRHQKDNDETEIDITNLNWTTYGSLVHNALEQVKIPFAIKEQRLRHKIELNEGKIIELSGAFDLYDIKKKRLVDYKFTSAWSMKYEDSIKKYYKQLLIYAWLLYHEGFEVKEVNNFLMFKNWAKKDYLRAKDSGYPPVPFLRLSYDINEKHIEMIDTFIKDRIEWIWSYKDTEDDKIPRCKDRWNNNKKCKDYCPVNKFCHFGERYKEYDITTEDYNDYKTELTTKLNNIENEFKEEL